VVKKFIDIHTEALETTGSCIRSKLKISKFKDEELKQIASILGCEYRSGFYFHNPDVSFDDDVSIQYKIEAAWKYVGLTKTQFAEKLGMSKQNWNARFKNGKFSDADYLKMVEVLGCEYRSGFYFPDGNKVE
jgi:hypothetical protein